MCDEHQSGSSQAAPQHHQIFAIDAGQEGQVKFSRITMADQGDFPI